MDCREKHLQKKCEEFGIGNLMEIGEKAPKFSLILQDVNQTALNIKWWHLINGII